jgi:thioredoxin-related protein
VDMGESAEQVKAYVAKHRLSFSQLLDPSTDIASMFSIRATPTNFLVDRQGNILAGGPGYRDWTTPEAHRLIQHLLREGR